MKWFLSATLSAVVIVLAGCSTPLPKPTPARQPLSSVTKYALSLQEAYELVTAREYAKAHALLKSRMPDPRFELLTPKLQYYWLHNAASLAYGQRDLDYACATNRRASDTGYATVDDWHMRFDCASRKKNLADGIQSLETALNRWPNALETFKYFTVASFVREVLRSDIPAPDQQSLLEKLFAVNWRGVNGVEPDRYWPALARMYMEQGRLERAKEIVLRVTGPRSLLAMRVSRQLDPLVQAMPDHFDLPAAIDRYNASLEQLSRASPRLLAIKVMHANALNNAGQYKQALAVVDEALGSGEGAPRYDDAKEYLQWLFNARAVAMNGLGRFDDAEKDYLEGIRVSAETPNVSQAINLAEMYADLQRWDEAEAKVREVPLGEDSISPYGEMQVHRVLLRAASGKHDESAMAAALDKLKILQTTSISTFQKALLDAKRMDEAAALLITRLRDRKLSEDALLDVQDYSLANPSPGGRLSRELWSELRSRQDVQAAVAEVGRVEVVPLSR
ncbi:MAG TPA: hypothetical protein VIU34_06935 [Steroidobacter sp.]